MKTHSVDTVFNQEENVYNNQNDTISHNKKSGNCYYSNVMGEYIKDAITGEKYPWRVGSNDETRFFRVTNATNMIDTGRRGISNSYMGRDSRKAFYENPHAYMRHRHIELDEDFINEWYEKHERLYPKIN